MENQPPDMNELLRIPAGHPTTPSDDEETRRPNRSSNPTDQSSAQWGVFLYTVVVGIGEGMGGVYIMPAIVISFFAVLVSWSKEN